MAVLEGLVLDTLALNDDTNYRLEEVQFPPPPRLAEWVRSADSDGSLLTREPPADNREITAKVRVVAQATTDLADAKVAAILDKLQEAARNPTGIDLVWTPAGGTISMTFKVLFGEVTELPIDHERMVGRSPAVMVKMTCSPYGYGAEVVGSATSSSLPVMTVELTGVTGDVPAEGRLIVTDNASQSRRLVRWGLESCYYPTSSPPSLLLDNPVLVTSGYAGTTTTRTGAYVSNGVIRATLGTQPTAVCGLGNLTHVGTFRVFARVYAAASGAVYARLAWQEGDGPLRANGYVAPPAVDNFSELDLGIVTIPEKTLGTQRWTGRIEAYTDTVGDTLDVDYVYLMPIYEGAGEGRADYNYNAGIVVARDDFSSTGGALNGNVAALGGTWATSGAATDFSASTGPTGTTTAISRATTSDASPRLAILGSTNYTNTEVGVDYYSTAIPGGSRHQGVIARYVDANNYLRVTHLSTTHPTWDVWVQAMIAGVPTLLARFSPTQTAASWYSLKVVVYASGRGFVILSGNGQSVASFYHSALDTGGALATGKPGIIDQNGMVTAATRYYDNFYASTPATEQIVCYSGQSIECRYDGTQREDSTGTYWGPAPAYRGANFLVPVAGTRTRKARVAVVARRNNVTADSDDQIADSTTVQVAYTPRYLLIPR